MCLPFFSSFPSPAEASILSHLHHPAIVQHLESFEENGNLCIVTEYCERGDLAQRLEEKKGILLSEQQVLDWLVQCCLALLYLHKRKCLHRDLKLQNIYVMGDNELRLGDFGEEEMGREWECGSGEGSQNRG